MLRLFLSSLLAVAICLTVPYCTYDDAVYLQNASSESKCNEDHLLTPVVNKEIRFQVLVQSTQAPLSGVDVVSHFFKTSCNGEAYTIYNKILSTNDAGIVEGEVPASFTWASDRVEWSVSIATIGYEEFKGPTEKFDHTQDFVYTSITISDLEN